MPWFKVDDQATFNPKVIRAGNAAFGAWVRMGAYCNAQLTNGVVEESVARMLATKKEIDSLVAAGLLHAVENGYEIHDYLEYQPSKDEVKAERAFTRNRVTRSREKAKGIGLWADVNKRDAGKCRYCRSDKNVNLDHILPVTRGGLDTLENLVMACRSCNSRKGDRTPEEAGMGLLPIPTELVTNKTPTKRTGSGSEDSSEGEGSREGVTKVCQSFIRSWMKFKLTGYPSLQHFEDVAEWLLSLPPEQLPRGDIGDEMIKAFVVFKGVYLERKGVQIPTRFVKVFEHKENILEIANGTVDPSKMFSAEQRQKSAKEPSQPRRMTAEELEAKRKAGAA